MRFSKIAPDDGETTGCSGTSLETKRFLGYIPAKPFFIECKRTYTNDMIVLNKVNINYRKVIAQKLMPYGVISLILLTCTEQRHFDK